MFVSREDLVRIFDNKPAIYTWKLATLIFGKNLYPKKGEANNLEHLDQYKLKALISKSLDYFHFYLGKKEYKYLRTETFYSFLCDFSAHYANIS